MDNEIKIGDLVIYKLKDAMGAPKFLQDASYGVVTEIMHPDRWPGTAPSPVIEVRWSTDISKVYHHDKGQLEVISR